MKKIKILRVLILIGFFSINYLGAQEKEQPITKKTTMDKSTIKTYLIERNIPGAGDLTATDLKGISQKSCDVLKEMGPDIQWVNSYVTQDKIYCVYRAPNKEMILEHAKKGGFPANHIIEIENQMSPRTAEQ